VSESANEERPRVPLVGERWFRERAFTARVREAYENRCAFTGLRILNGGGRPEVQAAHIQPVARSGPDALRNGLALSGTMHWMFDRGLISLDDDGRLLLAEESVPAEVRRLLRPDLHALLPEAPEARPHPQFLRFHRQKVFKGASSAQ
jgi:putative restriction endonuclease